MKKFCLGVIAALSVAAVSFAQAEETVKVTKTTVMTVEPMVKVVLKIKEPLSLRHHQKMTNQSNEITIGNKNFRLPAEATEITVMHTIGHVGAPGKPIELRIAYNGTPCNIEISGKPLEHPARMITIHVGERKMANGQMMGYCEKAVISGTK
jgi:hypothetical protein